MHNIIDPTKFDVIGASGRTPKGEPGSGNFGITSGRGLVLTSISRDRLPAGPSLERAIKNWQDFDRSAKEELDEFKRWLDKEHAAKRILKAGQIPPDEMQIFNPIVYGEDGSPKGILMEDIIKNPDILAMTPEERLQNEKWLSLLDAAESNIERTVQTIKSFEQIIRTSEVFGVVVRGPAAEINKLRLRPEISIVDPVLFPGAFGMITEGRENLVIDFMPTVPDAHLY